MGFMGILSGIPKAIFHLLKGDYRVRWNVLEFNLLGRQGDVGVAGGMQITEPASEHVVLKASLCVWGVGFRM